MAENISTKSLSKQKMVNNSVKNDEGGIYVL